MRDTCNAAPAPPERRSMGALVDVNAYGRNALAGHLQQRGCVAQALRQCQDTANRCRGWYCRLASVEEAARQLITDRIAEIANPEGEDDMAWAKPLASRRVSAHRGAGARSPSPRLQGEGRGEGRAIIRHFASPPRPHPSLLPAGAYGIHTKVGKHAQRSRNNAPRGATPHPAALTPVHLLPHAVALGRREARAVQDV
jgi:hypothetical protein